MQFPNFRWSELLHGNGFFWEWPTNSSLLLSRQNQEQMKCKREIYNLKWWQFNSHTLYRNYIYIYIYIYICVCVCVCVCECICIFVCIYLYTYTCVYVYLCICVYIYIYIYVCVCVCVCVYVCVYACVCMHIFKYVRMYPKEFLGICYINCKNLNHRK